MSARTPAALTWLGRSGVLALGLWCAALTALFSFVLPLSRGNEQLRRLVAERRPDTGRKIAELPERRIAPLPGEATRARDLVMLTSSAERRGIRITQRSFAEPPTPEAGPVRLSGRIVAAGAYPSIRRWLAEITPAMPTLSIRNLRLERPEAPGQALQMSLEFDYLSTRGAGSASLPVPGPGPVASVSAPFAGPFADPFALPAPDTPPSASARSTVPIAAAALPFAYGGRYQTSGTDIVLLTVGDEVYRVRAGEVVADGAFRLDSADREALQFTHLPSNRRLSLPIGHLPP